MKKNITKIDENDIIRISDIYFQKNIDNQQSFALSKEINSLRFSLLSQAKYLDYDSEAFNFSNTLLSLKK
tara:strand:+ start:62 stop:271 length:210 start_codon:yes stop_codon:yes gene_type:complete